MQHIDGKLFMVLDTMLNPSIMVTKQLEGGPVGNASNPNSAEPGSGSNV
jgi:hypothetical protein